MKLAIIAAVCAFAFTATAQADVLACNKMSPIVHDYAGASWDVYGCDDNHSVELVGRPDTQAAGAIFTFRWDGNSGYNLIGKAGSDHAASDVAFRTLGKFASSDVMYLYGETVTQQSWKLAKLVAGGQVSAVPEPPPPAFGHDTIGLGR